MQLLVEVIDHLVLKVLLDEVSRDVEDVDGVGEVAEDVDEGLSHLSPHVEVSVLVLEQLDGVLDRAVRCKVLHDLSIDVEEDLYFVLRQVGVLVFVVELNGGVQERLPDLLGVVLAAHLY